MEAQPSTSANAQLNTFPKTQLCYRSQLVKSIKRDDTEILRELLVRTVKQIPAGPTLIIFIDNIT